MAPKKPQRRQPRDYFYGEVLHLPPGTVRPDHYALLGVPYFEPDHDVILRAALGRLRLLEACVVDPRPAYRAAAETLLSEVRHAQLTLLDPERRRAYDATLLGTSADGDGKAVDDREADLPAGKMLQDRYRVIREVRPGGFGRVYEALDRNLRFKVHLTVLRPRLSKDREARRSVERAARTAASVDHPGLLRIDEVGDTEGLLLARTRPVEGRTLIELVEATPRMRLDAEEARRIAGEIAAALAHAHAQGAVHGDLRPHNVYVDEQGRVVVADLAVSRAVSDASGAAGGPFREPENEASPKGDLFALGCLLFQMLAGMPPFAADGAREEARPLPDDVPRGLAEAVRRLMHPDPDHRPKDAAAVAEMLQRELANGLVEPKRRRLGRKP